MVAAGAEYYSICITAFIPAVGVEANTETYEEAVENAAMYKLKAKHIAAPVEFVHCRAQDTGLRRDNCFYFQSVFRAYIQGSY